MLKEQFIADRKVLKINHSFKARFIANADWFCRLSREVFAKRLKRFEKRLQRVCEAFAKGLRSICKGFEKRLKHFGNRLTVVSKGFEKCLKYFPSICKEFAKGLQSV